MAAPTQEYPPWLTPVPNTIFDQNGVPIATSTTILYLPLTYYGPSIPLGPEWTYGGLTPPASTIFISSTATPSSSSSSSSMTATATPTPTSPVSTSVLSSLSSSFTSTPTAIPPPPPPQPIALTRGQLIGIILGAVFGGIVVFLALFVCFLLYKNRRRNQRVRFSTLPIDQDYIVVDPEARSSGDGAPRESGEEGETLLHGQRRQGASGQAPQQRTTQRDIPPQQQQPVAGPSSRPMQQISSELGARPGVTRVPAPPTDTVSTNNSNGTGSSGSTEMSSLGEIVPNSRLSSYSPLVQEQRERQRAAAASTQRGQIMSPEAQRQVEEQTLLDIAKKEQEQRASASTTSLPPPPRIADPENLPPPRLVTPTGSGRASPQVQTALIPAIARNIKGHDSYVSSNRSSSPEPATLLTARRVKPLEWSARAEPYYYTPLSDQPASRKRDSTGSNSGGLFSSITGKLSWFKNLDALPSSGSTSRRSDTPRGLRLSDKDAEAGRALLSPTMSDSSEPQSPPYPYRDEPLPVQQRQPEPQVQSITRLRAPHISTNVGLNPDGTRPTSGVSGVSGSSGGGTTYYDAYSSIPGTPVLTPLPRALTPAQGFLGAQPSSESGWRHPSPLSASVSAPVLRQESPRGEATTSLEEFGGRSQEAGVNYDENDTITRSHSGQLAGRTSGVDILDIPAPSALSIFRTVVPMGAVTSTSTVRTTTTTVRSTISPTLFTQTEGTLSASTSQTSIEKSPGADNNNQCAKEDEHGHDSTHGGYGGDGEANTTASSIQTLSLYPTPPGLGAKELKAKFWPESLGAINETGQTSCYLDAPDVLQSSSQKTSSSNMTGTTLAAIEENNTGISIDVLEEDPPLPGEGWVTLAGNVMSGSGTTHVDGRERRSTFGSVHPQQQQQLTLAELGSLQSIPSYLTPNSNRSSGSAPTSRRELSGSIGSHSSSRQHSLMTHSGSVSSQEGRRRYPSSSMYRYSTYTYNSGREGSTGTSNGPTSPALSAFGNRLRQQPSEEMPRNLTPLSENYAVDSSSSYYTAPSTLSRGNPNRSGTLRSNSTIPTIPSEVDVVDAARSEMQIDNDRELGLLNPRSGARPPTIDTSFSSAPWAAGLDQDWKPL
ncbi:hypothetical protein AMATHDRAFT_7410 [Amanita thiersii Skay4041]|uniref:Uncharacterized protein n=1 Tax=Amanita thiersii Skay4041 TaxID=703135 RepID=A0A2A9N8N2_9AGAR|nr:hypothetical protein AMATHDRAFT_7410 [Amanita thiersii Skay4041]